MSVSFGAPGHQPLGAGLWLLQTVASRSKGCLFRVLVGFHVGLFPGRRLRTLQTFTSRSKGCPLRVLVGFYVGLFPGAGASASRGGALAFADSTQQVQGHLGS